MKIKYYLAPLNKLGNLAFRKLCLENGADFVFSEMVRIGQLLENDETQIRKITIPKNQQEQTIIQIIAEDSKQIEPAIEKIKLQNPNIKEINYNMGCPQSSLCKLESGGGIIKNPNKIKTISQTLKQACEKHNLTPSIKTRIGITRDEINIFENLKIIEEAGIKKIYLHGRVLKEPYSKKATYNEIAQAIKMFPELEIIGNGDITNLDSKNKILQTKCHGIMIGRAALENPEIFNQLKQNIQKHDEKSGIEIKEKKDILLQYLKHAKTSDLTISHIKANISYITKNTIGGAELREQINNANGLKEVYEILKKID